MADVESLELKITSSAKDAERGLDALIDTLGRLRQATTGGFGLTNIATSLEKIGRAANTLNGSEGAKLDSLAKGLSALSGLGNIKLPSGFSSQLSGVANAVKALDGVDYSKVTELVKGLAPLETLGKTNLGSFLTQLKKFPAVVAELGKVNLILFGKQVQMLTASLKPLADEMQKIGNGFAAFPAKIQQVVSASTRIPAANKKSELSFVRLGAKLATVWFSLKRLGTTIASWIGESNDYVENLNLFSVSMGEYAESAMEYANQVSDVMGINPSEWIRNQGVFMTLGKGFGIAGDRASIMSQQLTQLGYDLSSFYNISVEEAMQKLKSGFSGELEPLRNLGYDLSQAKLEAVALSLGIDKTVSSMTQAEKAELRYYAVMNQVTWAQGDMARTLNDPANQLRVLAAQAKQAAQALGNIFIPMLKAILPWATAAVKVVRILANAIAGLFGYEFPEVKNIETGASGTASAFEEAADNAGKLKKTLLGIDELNVMSDSSGSGSDSGAYGGGGFDFELPTYNFIDEAVNTQINDIVEKMKEWLGITDEISSWSDLFDTRLGNILETVGLIGVTFGAWKVGVGIAAVIEWFKNSKLLIFFKNVGLAISSVATGASTLGEAITAVFGGATGIIGGVAMAIMGIIGYVTNLISMIREGESVSNILGAALGGLAAAGGGFLIAIGVGATVATGGIVALIVAIVAAVGMLAVVIINHWEEIKAAIGSAWSWLYDNVLSPIGNFFAGVATWFYDNVITPIVDFFKPVVTAIIDMAVLIYTKVKEIVSGVLVAIGSIFAKVGEIFLKIVEIAVALGKAFYTYVLSPIFEFIASVAVWVFDKILTPIAKFFAGVATWLYDTILKPIFDGISWLKDRAVELFTKIGTTVVEFISGACKTVINGVLNSVESSINKFIRLLNGAIDIINNIPGVSITKITQLSIPRLADGGMMENRGQMFVAREAGPELVGTIGNRTAVVNNDQIVESVSRGVYEAVVAAMGGSGGDRVVEAKVNDKVLCEVMVSRARQETVRTGYNPLLGGV